MFLLYWVWLLFNNLPNWKKNCRCFIFSLKNVNYFCQFLITLRRRFLLPGAKYNLLRNVGCMKEVQGNADIIQMWCIWPISAKGSTYGFRPAKCDRKPFWKSDTLSKDAGHWLASFLEYHLFTVTFGTFCNITSSTCSSINGTLGVDGLLKFYNL